MFPVYSSSLQIRIGMFYDLLNYFYFFLRPIGYKLNKRYLPFKFKTLRVVFELLFLFLIY